MPDTLRLTAALMVEDLEALRRAFHLDLLTLLGHSWAAGSRCSTRPAIPTRSES